MYENIVAVIGGFFIIFVGTLIIVHRILKKGTLELVDWTIAFCIFLYGFGFPLVIIGSHFNKNLPIKIDKILNFGVLEIILYSVLVCIMIGSIYIGWSLLNNRRITVFKLRESNVHLNNEKQTVLIKKFIRFAWFMLIVSFISYYLYARAYGGFLGLLTHTISIRSGISDTHNSFSFLQKFGQLSLIASYAFYAILLDGKIDKYLKKSCYLGMLISGTLSMYVAYSWGGRATIITFIFIYILTTAYYKSDIFINIIKRFSKSLIFVPIIFIGIDILWKRSGGLDFLTLLISSISYPFIAFIVNFKSGIYRGFIDILYTPLYFLPSSLWQERLNIETANSITTFLVNGAHKGESIYGRTVTGTSPNDLLSFGFMQANIIGVIITGLVFGMILRLIHNNIMIIKFNGIKWMIYSYCILRFAIGGISSGDISQIIIANWGFLVYLITFKLFSVIRA